MALILHPGEADCWTPQANSWSVLDSPNLVSALKNFPTNNKKLQQTTKITDFVD